MTKRQRIPVKDNRSGLMYVRYSVGPLAVWRAEGAGHGRHKDKFLGPQKGGELEAAFRALYPEDYKKSHQA